MTRRTSRVRAYAPDPGAPGRACDMPDCAHAGEYRAPKSRTHLNDYHWFCLQHVREYNARWDYYKGMSPGEIEANLRADISWGRPSWPLGRLGSGMFDDTMLRDPLHILEAGRARPAAAPAAAPPDLVEPLAVLSLPWPVTLDVAKSRWKALAKQHHPDANGGDRGAEERLKTINMAYAALRDRLAPEPRQSVG
jgi:hypothetical protein